MLSIKTMDAKIRAVTMSMNDIKLITFFLENNFIAQNDDAIIKFFSNGDPISSNVLICSNVPSSNKVAKPYLGPSQTSVMELFCENT